MNPKGGNINVDVLPHDYVKFIRVVFDVRGNVGSTAETTIRKYKLNSILPGIDNIPDVLSSISGAFIVYCVPLLKYRV